MKISGERLIMWYDIWEYRFDSIPNRISGRPSLFNGSWIWSSKCKQYDEFKINKNVEQISGEKKINELCDIPHCESSKQIEEAHSVKIMKRRLNRALEKKHYRKLHLGKPVDCLTATVFLLICTFETQSLQKYYL